MEKESLTSLFEILKAQGVFDTEEEMNSVIESDGISALYELMPQGMFETPEEFTEVFSEVKKKKSWILLLQRSLRNPLFQQSRNRVSLWTLQIKKLIL
jgi:hypothetical protein